MAILSETGLGAIHAGTTQMALTSVVTQTGDAELTVSDGSFTTSAGEAFPLTETALVAPDGNWRLELGSQDSAAASLRYVPAAGWTPPEGWQVIQILAGFGAGIVAENGEIVGDVYVLTVLPGSPDE